MQIKGTAVKGTQLFVMEVFPDRYQEWLNALSSEMQEAIKIGILAGTWYDLHTYVLEPTKIIGDLFYNGEHKKAGFEIGNFSAKYALKGVYKIFVKIASVDFVLKRTTAIFSTYYSKGKFLITYQDKSRVEFLSIGFKNGDELIFERITGWVQGIFEVISKHSFKVDYKIKQLDNNNLETHITSYWENES